MNKEDEIFDNFLRNKFESKTFANKPEYWQHAQEMIAKERKNTFTFNPIIVGTIAVIAAISAGLLLSTPSNTPDAHTLTASAATVGTTTSVSVISATPPSDVSAQPGTPYTSPSIVETTDPQQPNQLVTSPGSIVTSSKKESNKRPKRTKGLKPMDAVEANDNQTIHEKIQPGIVVLNGKTFNITTGFNTSNRTVQHTKTAAYLAQATREQKSYLGVEAGINLSNSLSISSAINAQVGLRYYRYISPKIALSAGLTYARVHQNLPARSYKSTDYDFGKNASAIRVTTQRLDYIELPVAVLYQFVPKHSLTAGVTLGYALQSSDKVDDEASGTQSMESGYLSAINRWDAQLSFGYQYQFTPALWIRTSCQLGLLDISNNTSFKQSETHTNKGLRLTVGYKIF
jgi:hypothetical protein